METTENPCSSNASTTSNTTGYSFVPLTEAEEYIATGKGIEGLEICLTIII